MRVTFPRLADHQRGYAVVERDDGVVYRMDGFINGPELPHDIRHLIVERELRVSDGIWGSIAAGTVYTSMQHLRGRRPPHSEDRSDQLKRAQRNRIMRAELLANLVEAVAALADPSEEEIRRLTRAKLSVIPRQGAGRGPRRADPGAAARGPGRRGQGAAGGGGALGQAPGGGGTRLRAAVRCSRRGPCAARCAAAAGQRGGPPSLPPPLSAGR